MWLPGKLYKIRGPRLAVALAYIQGDGCHKITSCYIAQTMLRVLDLSDFQGTLATFHGLLPRHAAGEKSERIHCHHLQGESHSTYAVRG
ncbi:hypothetical protein HBI56_202060 [Parastagonospora nodorum]|uniref:Uncharacterized protein n=1 Tax=Phaeosphaeria nodorum (strain SN15 / ATCC MYA-4574 / FGSC 10173) TaxID=321614 RepID=A0A7U2EZY0_PHANO|nr:hypothetical protein HBH56_216590 [Parastagonospora nodorum]QRC93949.1 hypothetical protein JI435_404800 [Parastagonospora nodorum SN15]KAH3922636.1 hypothetical protein HBH54_220940 [Parastagonospora nodorum]KAH3942204.1 hypothetical protein HBH53_190860 [Parastagonospora nodorum]KAH3961322.1 hypothetical protein HBH51_185260 [Parastagonospora nodorum]